ncbi:MAG: hypothetical protein A2756_00655 [Candidatus Ryanbacteria bacterium RIFCSPHIGHO2_01_FULL_48_27]|uniref:DUF1059 domain-containing protein n=1 Tax=Candidatus Ryanbacteria bacterium RIFCSPHIGHO2_01_FULL_48_27 TaxID=1802115 RepID=A0A1G2G5J1_9BACT|nr:MAG: hypothetical protein A2756_00655 [Candidatus Ryanbacteria bacterium RIFCSPHIGHO2_01_FULL_48_27]
MVGLSGVNTYMHMMKLSCKDLKPDVDCAFEATGETATDAAKTMLAHARADHAEDVKDGSDEDLIKMFESKAHE